MKKIISGKEKDIEGMTKIAIGYRVMTQCAEKYILVMSDDGNYSIWMPDAKRLGINQSIVVPCTKKDVKNFLFNKDDICSYIIISENWLNRLGIRVEEYNSMHGVKIRKHENNELMIWFE